MKDVYWKMFVDIKHKKEYLYHYRLMTHKYSFYISCFLLLSSSASIVTLTLWRDFPYIWGIIIITAQIIQALSPLLPYSERSEGLKFLLPEVEKLLIEIKNQQYCLEDYNDEEIKKLVHDFESKYNDLETKFIGSTVFPYNKSCAKKAEQECTDYFKYHFDV